MNGNTFYEGEKNNFALKVRGWLFKEGKFRTKSECEKVVEGLGKGRIICDLKLGREAAETLKWTATRPVYAERFKKT